MKYLLPSPFWLAVVSILASLPQELLGRQYL
jgi:hypothetical protein